MYRVDIYLEIELEIMKTTRNCYGYLLECSTKEGVPHTVNGFGERIGTKNQVTLSALIDALKRINQSCELCIHTSNAHVAVALQKSVKHWVANGYKTVKGKDIANIEEWQQVAKLTSIHLLTVEQGYHQYTEWLKYEMRRRK